MVHPHKHIPTITSWDKSSFTRILHQCQKKWTSKSTISPLPLPPRSAQDFHAFHVPLPFANTKAEDVRGEENKDRLSPSLEM